MTVTPIYLLLLFFPALIALYFLKLKRHERVVSSTILWQRSVEDLHVNAPFQRLRSSLLLLLQLLVVGGLIFALWRPRAVGELETGESMVVLIDTSASVGAVEGEETRLDRAKAHAHELVNAMELGNRMSILTFNARTRTIEPLTDDVNSLHAAIDRIELTAAPTRMSQALIDAGALAQSVAQAEVRVIGDSSYGDLSTLPEEIMRLKLDFHNTATRLDNIAITELDVRQSFELDQHTEVLAVVNNFSSQEWSGTVSLFFGDELQDARPLTIAPDEAIPTAFSGTTLQEGLIRVSIDSNDALAIDNDAWVFISPPKPVRALLVGPENLLLDNVLATAVSATYRRMSLGEYESATLDPSVEDVAGKLDADVVIFDRAAPSGPPVMPAIYIACRPQFEGNAATELANELSGESTDDVEPEEEDDASRRDPLYVEWPTIVDWDRTHPVNRFLVYADLSIEKARTLGENDGFHPLVDTDKGVIVGWRTFRPTGRAPVSTVVIGFDLLESSWWELYSFPIFFANTLQWLHRERSGRAKGRYRTGDPLAYRPDEEADAELRDWDAVRFLTPSGQLVVPSRDEYSNLVLATATEAGIYEVVDGDETLAWLPVSVLNDEESRLVPEETIELRDYTVETTSATEQGMKDLWKWFAVAALLFLFVEWFVYNRRLGL